MAEGDAILENRDFWMESEFSGEKLMLKSAVINESLSELTKTKIEFFCKDKALKLEEVVGKKMSLHLKTAEEGERKFLGTCISVEFLGLGEGYGHFTAEVRPWTYFLTRTNDCKVFQDKDVKEIIKDVFDEYGFTDYEFKTSGSYEKRVYCVQYRESDFDFISRLMEEEGIYYFYTHQGTTEKMILADGLSAHKPVPENSEIEFQFREAEYRRNEDHVFEWTAAEIISRGIMTLDDFNFETPSSDLVSQNMMVKGKHNYKSYEVYDPPGRYLTTALGEKYARIRMEAEAIRHQIWQGVGNVRTFGVGYRFTLKEHPRVDDSKEHLIRGAIHKIQIETDYDDRDQTKETLGERTEFTEENKDAYSCEFQVVPISEQFRAPLKTRWPRIPGLHTAIVVGKAGEEIWTDKYGRIKIQFHWDRIGSNDENSSCWVRTVVPWSGKNWGMIAVPRMGQEVVIQFEEGDPDRPICTGMLYNAEHMPPYELPKNKTQSGLKTNSSKGGGGCNELMMEDLKDEELIRFQAERDYQQIVKNDAEILIGLEKSMEGNLTQTVYNNQTETVKMGDHTFTVETGSQIETIKTDKTETVEDGNYTATVSQGNYDTTVSTGDFTVDATSSKIELTAGIEITLTVGPSSIKIDNSGVTIKGPMINIQGDTMAEMKAPLTTVKADTLLTLKGQLTMIN